METSERIGKLKSDLDDGHVSSAAASVSPASTTPESSSSGGAASEATSAGLEPTALALESSAVPEEAVQAPCTPIPPAFEAEFDRIVASVSPCEDSARYRAGVYDAVEAPSSLPRPFAVCSRAAGLSLDPLAAPTRAAR